MSEINDLINKIVKEASQQSADHAEPVSAAMSVTSQAKMTAADYPLFKKHPEMVNAPNGKNVKEITIEAAIAGQVKPEDLRIAPATLKAQGEIAESAGRGALKGNFDRAAELTGIPDERLLEMYGALRPYRSTKPELLAIADELENQYGAKITADFVREAADMYTLRKKFKGDN